MSKKPRPEKRAQKTIYTIYSPRYFGYKEIGTTLAAGPEHVIGRTLWVSLYTLTGDFSKQYMLIRFKVVRVKDSIAETIFYGHEYGREFVRSLVRRGTSRIDMIVSLVTKDGFHLRVQATAFTMKRIGKHSWKAKMIRETMKNVLENAAKELVLAQLAQEMVLGKTASDIYQEAKKIMLLRHVGLIKSKVLKVPEWVYTEERAEVEEVAAEQGSEVPAG
ncbi:MAG: 30S ribosomal protein S3ae [Nitrososphaeria archaeon]|nr:30S ribosomal protein S3ae [Aigarchaeota archaeon]MCX8187418.1 30S ribosomal protein S3ae [Nitrososphaeria archaeon]MDW8021351.1 30S ribosomal protein S3ae [Nitrososphaerota archaeon]